METRSVSHYQQTGISPSYSYSNSGGATSTPAYGITHSTEVDTHTVYDRVLHLDLWPPNGTDKPNKVYESTLKNSGSCGQIEPLLVAFLDVMSEGFPAARSGTVQKEFKGCWSGMILGSNIVMRGLDPRIACRWRAIAGSSPAMTNVLEAHSTHLNPILL